MSKLNELIQQLCPDGVEWTKIKDHFTRLRGTAITAGKMKEIADEQGDIRIFAGGKTVINAFEKDIPNANITRVPSVLVQSRGIIDVVYYEQPFTFKNEMWAYTSDYNVSVKFLFYYLKNNIEDLRQAAIGMGAMPQISLSATEEMIIPLPPLPVQEEIVRILDTFTESTNNLKEQIQTRRKQYEYYRNQLLDLEGKEGVEMKTLEDASLKITDGSHSSPKSTTEGYYMPSVKDMTDTGFDFSKCKIISKFDFDILKRNGCCPQKNDVLIAKDGSMLRYVFSVKENMDIALLSSIAIIRPKDIIQPDFMAYYFKQAKIRDKVIREYGKGGGVPRIILKNFKKINIPIPPLSEQERIVNILAQFEASITNLELQLKQREKQYEYYRNQLLDFKKKEE